MDVGCPLIEKPSLQSGTMDAESPIPAVVTESDLVQQLEL